MAQDKDRKNLNVPPLRFHGFPDEWKTYSLSNFFDFKNGLNPEANRFGQGIKFISVSDILNNDYIDYDRIIAAVTPSKKELEEFGVNRGDILFQRSSETLEDVGRANVYMDDRIALFGGFVIRGKKKSEYEPYFMRYALSAPVNRKKIIVKGAGAQHFNIGQDGLSKVLMNIPDIDEQTKIGHLLRLIDERITAQNKIIDNLQSLIKGLNDSFHDNVNGEDMSFNEMGSSYSGLSGKSRDDFGQGSPYITYLNVYQNNIVDEEQIDLVSINANEKQNTISYGDILFTLSSETPEETGIGCVYLGQSGKYYLNSFCFGVSIIKPNKVYPPYLAYLVSSSKFRRFVYPLAQGSTRFNLHKNDFMRKKFKIAPIDRQEDIANTLDALSNRLSVEHKLIELYKKQKGYLLRHLFI